MLKKFLFSALIIWSELLFGQITVKLRQPPPNQLRASDLWNVILVNTGRNSLQVTINGTLTEAQEGIVIEGRSRRINLPPGVKMITYNDIKSGSVKFKQGRWREAFTRTGNAPSGNYTICIHVNDESGREKGSDCIDQTVMKASAPVLISPAEGETIKTEQAVFTWMSPMPPQKGVNYTLKIYELLGNQSAETAAKRNSVFFEKSDIRTTTFVYPVSARKFDVRKSYVWNVQAFDGQGNPISDNNGKSEPFSFRKGRIYDPFDTTGNLHASNTDSSAGGNGNTRSLTITEPDSTESDSTESSVGTAVVGDTIEAGQDGEFKVLVTQLFPEPDSSLTGRGTVYVDWLRTNVAVEFKKIKIDTAKKLTSGGIVSSKINNPGTSFLTYPEAWGLSLLSGPGAANVVSNVMNWTNTKINNVIAWVNSLNFGQPQISYNSNIHPPQLPSDGLKMPFGLQFDNANQKLIITEMVFKPEESKLNLLAQGTFTKSGTIYKLGFVGKDFKFHQNKIKFNSGRVELAEDVEVPTPKVKFTFIKGEETSGCYIKWDSTGVKDAGLEISAKFSPNCLKTDPPSPDSVEVTLGGSGTSLSDIILYGSLAECEIPNSGGMKIMADSVAYDFSDTRNPQGIEFPDNYLGDTSEVWQGFFIKNFSLSMPKSWKTGSNQQPPELEAENLIIDGMGLTAKIRAIDVYNLQSGSIANLSASLDTVEVTFLNNSLTEGFAKGKIVLPISKDTTANSLDYTASFAQLGEGDSLQLTVSPAGSITATILKGTLNLYPTSNITVAVTPVTRSASIDLNGKFKWNNPFQYPPGVKMELDFENVGLDYTSDASGDDLEFSPGSWSFASPQKFIANFPVSIKKIYYKPLAKSSPELLRGALMMDVVANLTNDIGGATSLGAKFAIEFDHNAKKFTPKFLGVYVDSIAVHADQPAVKIDGYLKLFNHDNVFGDGFKAAMDVSFTAVSLDVNALVQFGNTTYNNNNQPYRYWRVEADAMFVPGIPFLPGVGFYGFGGGAYYNMKTDSVISTNNSGKYVYTFIPKKSTFGFMVKATIGTLPKVETLNADAELLAQFNQTTHGIEYLSFSGNFWMATKLTDRQNSKIYGGVNVSYNFPDKIFSMNSDLTINVPNVITTPQPVGFVMNIDGRNNKWYFKFGTPSAPNTVDVFGLNLYSYLMFGNDIPVPNGFTHNFVTGYTTAIGSPPGMGGNVGNGGVGDDTKTGKGIATGVGIKFDKIFNEKFYSGTLRNWYINAALDAGAEMNLAFIDQTGCPGINGYRASGSVGLYFNLSSGIKGIHKRRHVSDKYWNLFTIKTGAWLAGEFPNPVHLYGAVDGQISIFDGLVNQHWYKSFEYGTSCSGTAVVTTNAPQEDKAADYRNKLIRYVAPNNHNNFDTTSTINVKYALVPGEVFDVAENQGDGTIKNRTFKLSVTTTLEVHNDNGTWAQLTLGSRLNNLGEYQYAHHISAMPSHTAVTVSQLSSSSQLAGLNTANGNTHISSVGFIHIRMIGSPLPPPPAPSYPNPVPDLVNHLTADKDYRFKVTATLMEASNVQVRNTGVNAARGTGYHTELAWTPAKTISGAVITEHRTFSFRTGAMVSVSRSTTSSRGR